MECLGCLLGLFWDWVEAILLIERASLVSPRITMEFPLPRPQPWPAEMGA